MGAIVVGTNKTILPYASPPLVVSCFVVSLPLHWQHTNGAGWGEAQNKNYKTNSDFRHCCRACQQVLLTACTFANLASQASIASPRLGRRHCCCCSRAAFKSKWRWLEWCPRSTSAAIAGALQVNGANLIVETLAHKRHSTGQISTWPTRRRQSAATGRLRCN